MWVLQDYAKSKNRGIRMKKILLACLVLLLIMIAGCSSSSPTGNFASEDGSETNPQADKPMDQPRKMSGTGHQQTCY